MKSLKTGGDDATPKPYPFQRPFTGAIKQGNLCVDSMDGLEGESVGIGRCHGHGRNQVR